MDNNKNYEVNGGGGSSLNGDNYNLNGSKTAVTEHFDNQTDEQSPLLPRAGAADDEDGGSKLSSTDWVGAADFEGLHWTKRPSVSSGTCLFTSHQISSR